MIVEQGTEALVTQLADEIIERLAKSYDLVYVQHDDQLMDTQVAKLVRGDDDWSEESWEWESDNRYESAKYIIGELTDEVIAEWEAEAGADLKFVAEAFKFTDEWDRVRYEIEERDESDWARRLAALTPNVLLRINVIDEDNGYSYEQDLTAMRVLKDLGVEATEANIKTVNGVLLETSPEYSVLLGYWIVGADVASIYDLPYDTKEVEIVNPYLYLGNPFTGSGFISEMPLDGVVRVKREDLRTDEDAFGYAVNEIYGGLSPSSFEATIRPVSVTV